MPYKITDTLPTEGSFIGVWKTKHGMFSESYRYNNDGVILTYVEHGESILVDDFIEDSRFPWNDFFNGIATDVKFIVEE